MTLMIFAHLRLTIVLKMNYYKCKGYIRSDFYRLSGRNDIGIFRISLYTLHDIGFRFMFWWRLSQLDGVLCLIPRLILYHLRLKHKINIERQTQIGYGFRIGHNGPITINSSAIIGDNVTMMQYSTIGSTCNNAADVGSNVYIGPNVCIVENVTIGDGVTIGAGSVVVKDVPNGATIGGNPSKIISHKEPGRLVWNKWNKSWNNAK